MYREFQVKNSKNYEESKSDSKLFLFLFITTLRWWNVNRISQKAAMECL